MNEETAQPAEEAPVADLQADTGAQPAVEESADTQEGVSDPLADLLEEALGTEEAPDVIDVEYEGKTYKLPPELKDAVLRQSDYTRKTMDLADQRKAIEAEARQLADANAITKEEIGAAVQYQMVQEKMQALLSTDVSDLSPEDVTALRLDFSDLEKQASQWANALQLISEKRQQSTSQQMQQARDAAIKEAARTIPNFTVERRQALEQFAVENGAAAEEVANLTDPKIYKLLHLADIGQRFINSQGKARKVEAAQAVKPVSEVGGGKSASSKDPDRMTPEEYHQHRLKQRAGK